MTHSDLTFSPRNSREIGGFLFPGLSSTAFFHPKSWVRGLVGGGLVGFQCFWVIFRFKIVSGICSGSFCSTSDI